MPSCGQRPIMMAADDALMQVMCESCGRLCSKKSFLTVDEISVMCCNLRYFTLTNMNWI